MTATIANAAELYVAPGGPSYRFAPRLVLARFGPPSALRRVVWLIMITWVPMCAFALLQGYALGPTPRDSFLLDFATYARFFLGIPILVIAESVIGPRLRRAGLQFVEDGFIRESDYPVFERAVARLAKRRESTVAMVILISLALFGAWNLTLESASGVGTGGWKSMAPPLDSPYRYNLAAVWSHFVSLPVLLFLWYRWLWRLAFWTLFLFDVSRLDLQLVPTHSDSMGGLGFLEVAHYAFSMFAFFVGCLFSAEIAFRVVYEGARINIFQVPVLVMIVLMQVLFLGPLLVFTPVMARVRLRAIVTYGALVVRYNRAFQAKWIDCQDTSAEPLLGNADVQSLADTGNTFHFVDDMQLVPFGRWAVILIGVATLLPGLPLLLIIMPLNEILDMLARVAL